MVAFFFSSTGGLRWFITLELMFVCPHPVLDVTNAGCGSANSRLRQLHTKGVECLKEESGRYVELELAVKLGRQWAVVFAMLSPVIPLQMSNSFLEDVQLIISD